MLLVSAGLRTLGGGILIQATAGGCQEYWSNVADALGQPVATGIGNGLSNRVEAPAFGLPGYAAPCREYSLSPTLSVRTRSVSCLCKSRLSPARDHGYNAPGLAGMR